MRQALALLGILAAGCGGGDGPAAADAGPGILQPPPPEGGQQLASTEYTLQPGEEKYFCWTFYSPEVEQGVTRVEPINGQLVHHVALFKTLAPEEDGFHECNQIIKTTWEPIWAGGAGADPLDLPAGVAFKIAPVTQYVVQYHLNNPSDEPVTERSGINLTYADPAPLIAAGLFALGSFNLTIPAGAMDFQQIIECSADRMMNVFAAFPHMHKLGKSLVFEAGPSAAEAQTMYAKDPWIFGDQPMEPVDFQITPGTFLRATCTWDNTTGGEVVFGESSENEMCFMTVFYYPFDSLGGCIQ
jgi:hypothetical protein